MGMMQLFTVDSTTDPADINLTVYKIKRQCQSPNQILQQKVLQESPAPSTSGQPQARFITNKQQLLRLRKLLARHEQMCKSTYRLQSFRIIKYSTVRLDFVPKTIELQDPFFLLYYENNAINHRPDAQSDSGPGEAARRQGSGGNSPKGAARSQPIGSPSLKIKIDRLLMKDQIDEDDDAASSTRALGVNSFLDIFEKTGEPVKRINLADILKEHNLTL